MNWLTGNPIADFHLHETMNKHLEKSLLRYQGKLQRRLDPLCESVYESFYDMHHDFWNADII